MPRLPPPVARGRPTWSRSLYAGGNYFPFSSNRDKLRGIWDSGPLHYFITYGSYVVTLLSLCGAPTHKPYVRRGNLESRSSSAQLLRLIIFHSPAGGVVSPLSFRPCLHLTLGIPQRTSASDLSGPHTRFSPDYMSLPECATKVQPRPWPSLPPTESTRGASTSCACHTS